jgi:hypothetical protein
MAKYIVRAEKPTAQISLAHPIPEYVIMEITCRNKEDAEETRIRMLQECKNVTIITKNNLQKT